MIAQSYIDRYYHPDYASRVTIDGNPILENMVESRLPETGLVLDIGAGEGSMRRHPCKRPGIRVIGVDSSDEVKLNTHLDDYVIQNAESLPFETASVDCVFSDFTFEHLETPQVVLREVSRVLKPGKPFVFRTVNALHYVAIFASILRGEVRSRVLEMGGRSADSLFPTYYRCNTRSVITRSLNRNRFNIEEIVFIEGPPVYLTFSSIFYRLGVLYERAVNVTDKASFLRANILVAARKY